MSQYGYGRSNPYDQRSDGAQPGYGAPSPQYGGYSNGPAMGRDEYEGRSTAWDRNSPNSPINSPGALGTNVEMEPLTGTGTSFPRQQDPNAILNECRDVDGGIREIKAQLKHIQQDLHTAVLNNPDSGNRGPAKQLEDATAELMAMYRNLTGRVKNIKQKPESGSPRNAPQVGKIDRELKETLQQYRTVEADFTRRLREQAARQYRIVRPDASEAEVQEAIEDPNQQMFSQALMQSDRRGQAQSTMRAVTDRHEAIKKIEQQMIELSELFQDMDNLVVQQEAAVTNIEMKGEEVVDHMDKGNEQIGVAIQSARNTRKWKWWCLGICVLIIIIIVVVVLIYKFVISTPVKVTTKRFVLADAVPAIKLSTDGHAVVPGQDFKPSSKIVVPGLEWKEKRLVVPGVDYVPGSRKFRRFQA